MQAPQHGQGLHPLPKPLLSCQSKPFCLTFNGTEISLLQAFALEKRGDFHTAMESQHYHVPFWVKEGFERTYPRGSGARIRLEQVSVVLSPDGAYKLPSDE